MSAVSAKKDNLSGISSGFMEGCKRSRAGWCQVGRIFPSRVMFLDPLLQRQGTPDIQIRTGEIPRQGH